MLLASILVAPHAQINVSRLNLVKECENTITSHYLPIEVIRLERFDLCVAIFPITGDILVLAEFNELG